MNTDHIVAINIRLEAALVLAIDRVGRECGNLNRTSAIKLLLAESLKVRDDARQRETQNAK